MSEETTLTPPAEPTPPASPTVPYADHEGNLRKDWYVDEELKGSEETLKRFKNIKNLAKSYEQVRKMVGTDVVKRPNDKSTEDEWNAYYDAGGRPKVALDYNFTKPDELPPEHYSEKVALEAMELFHKLGYNPKQAKGAFDFHNNLVIEAVKAQEASRKLEVQTAKDELVNELGAAYASREHLGNVAIEIGCKGATPTAEDDAELKAILLEDFGANPWFARFMMNIGKHFAEHSSEIISQVPTPGDIQSQINEIMKKPEYTSTDKKVRQPLIDQVMTLRNQLNKSKGIT